MYRFTQQLIWHCLIYGIINTWVFCSTRAFTLFERPAGWQAIYMALVSHGPEDLNRGTTPDQDILVARLAAIRFGYIGRVRHHFSSPLDLALVQAIKKK